MTNIWQRLDEKKALDNPLREEIIKIYGARGKKHWRQLTSTG